MMLGNADLFTPREPASPIVEQSWDNSGRWRTEALQALEKLWRECRHNENQFTFEMLRFPIVKACGEPHSDAVWGGLCRMAIRKGWIQCCGVANAVSGQANGSLRRKYVWGRA